MSNKYQHRLLLGLIFVGIFLPILFFGLDALRAVADLLGV